MYHQDMDGLHRNLHSKIDELLNMFPVVLILGVRQCGKTTLAKQCRQKWKYFDLENSSDFDFISKDYDFFFNEYNEKVIIDEAQELPELFKNLRGVIDQKDDMTNRYILTGSSSPKLFELVSDSLAGRVGIIELGTFKINEIIKGQLSPFYSIFENKITHDDLKFLKKIEIDKNLDPLKFILRGGYPKPVLKNKKIYFEQWMENYFKTYINRDIKKLFPKLDSIKFRRFISMLSELSGTIINKAQLGRSIDVNEVTIRDYLDIADKTFVWRIIPSYENSKTKSIVKMPKGIMRDIGLIHYLLDIDTRERMIRSPKIGQNFESFVIEEIIKGINATSAVHWDYYYYRTKSGAEIDLILQGRFGVVPIEIKFATYTTKKQLTSLKNFILNHDLPFGIVINMSSEIKMLDEKIIQVPINII